jgi:cytochrome c biogenesis protein CcmG/thiol:disulfide interchange protein DsbE
LRKSLILAFLAIFCLLSCSRKQSVTASASSVKRSANRTPAAEFTLNDENGAAVKLSDYRGKVVLLNFWATWCGPCGVEIPWFVDFEQKYKSQGFAVLGVSMDEEGWPAVKPFVAERKINYRILLGNDSMAQLYGGLDSLPTSYIIDRDGKVAFPPHIGLISKNEYINEIQCLLGDRPVDSLPVESASTSAAAACPAK